MITILVLLLFLSLILLVLGIIKPTLYSIILKNNSSRRNIALIFGSISLLIFILIGVIPTDKKEVVVNQTNEKEENTVKSSDNEDLILGILFQGALTDLGVNFARAKTSTDLLLKGSSNLSREEWLGLADQTIAKWQKVDESQIKFQAVVDVLPDYKISLRRNDNYQFIRQAYAAEDPFEADWNARFKADETRKNSKDGTVVTYEEKQILTAVDKAPPQEKIQVAANLFHSDYETANTELQKLRERVGKEELTKVDMYDNLSKTSQKIETGSKVALFVGGVITGTGTLNAIATGISGAGLIFDVSGSLVSLGIADKDGYAAYIAKGNDSKVFKVASVLVSIKDLGKALQHYDKLYSAIVGKDGKITMTAIKEVARNKELVDEIKEDGIGNAQTVYDWGDKTWKFLTENPDVKTITFDPKEGKVVIAGSRTSQLIYTSDPQAIKAIGDFVKTLRSEKSWQADISPTPQPAETGVRIVKACASGLLTVYTDCGTGKKVQQEWARGKSRFALNPDGRSLTPKISGGRGNYTVTVYLNNGESAVVANYDGPTNAVSLTEEAKNLGWTLTNGTIRMPNSM